MLKINTINYVLGIILALFLFTILSNYYYFVENIQQNVLKYSFIFSSNSELLIWSIFFIGILFCVNAFQMDFYAKKPDDKVSLYFGINCWFTILTVITTILPVTNWEILLKLVYINSYITILVFHYYIHIFLNIKAHKALSFFIWTIVTSLIIITLFSNVQHMFVLFKFGNIIALIYSIYCAYLSFQQKDVNKFQKFGNLFSLIIMILTKAHHIFIAYNLIDDKSLQAVGYFIFYIIHSALNADRFLNSYSQTVKMKNILHEKVKERTQELELANNEMIRIEQEKSQLISNICHDLSNPIASISMVSKGILDGVVPTKNKHYIAEILNQSNIMEKLLTDLRQLNSLESNELSFHMVQTDWYHFMELLFNNYRTTLKREEIEYELHIKNCTINKLFVMIDPFRIEQVFLNIISNSIKYTPVGGKIIVIVGMNAEKEHAFMTITDNGIGIESEKLPLIYERFYRTEPVRKDKESTGLGLSIVQSIVEKHKGKIEVTSEQGVGTSFTVLFPLI